MKVLALLIAVLPLVFATFDLNLAKRNVLHSFTSYCGDLIDQSWSCYWCSYIDGFTWVSNFGESNGDFFGYAGYYADDETIVVAIRGTDNIAGWIADADFEKVAYNNVPGALVHQGFYDDWNTYGSEAMGIVKNISMNLCPQCNSIIVTGHSLGAALATLASIDLQAIYNSTHSLVLYDYGSPRVGNQAFASFADSTLRYNTYRVVNKRDLVTKIPWRSMDYYHLAEEMWWDGSQWHYCDMSGEDPSCSDSQIVGDPLDHAVYMGIDVVDGVIHGCMWTDP